MVQFNFSYDEGTSLKQMLLFETAGRIWGEYLEDDVQINLHVGVVSASVLPKGVIGGALPGISAGQDYGEFRSQFQADMTSEDDQKAFRGLDQGGASYDFSVPEPRDHEDYWTYQGQTERLDLTRANAKALGLDVGNADRLDGYIMLSDLSGTGIRWDEDGDREHKVRQDTLEMMSVALHEIGHVLGFVSALDNPEWLKHVDASGSWQTTVEQMQDLAETATPMDLFRYTEKGQRSNLSYGDVGGDKFFSIDDGKKDVAEFATGESERERGDGFQASHWKNRGKKGIGIMDPALALEERGEISGTDLRLFDVMGWDLKGSADARAESYKKLKKGDDKKSVKLKKTYDKIKFQKTSREQYEAAEEAIAERLGISVRDLWNQTDAVEQLTQNRDYEVFGMLVDSQIYNVGWRNWRSRGSRARWEVFEQAFKARGLYSTLEGESLQEPPSTQNAPERNESYGIRETMAEAQDFLTGLPAEQALASTTAGITSANSRAKNDRLEGDDLGSLNHFSITPDGIGGTRNEDVSGLNNSLDSLSLGSGGTSENSLSQALFGLENDQLLGGWSLGDSLL